MNTLKTILYMGTMHGLFTYYFPYQIALQNRNIFDTGVFRFLAFPLWLIGTRIIIQCSVDIIRRGRGTPAHLDPPKQLVITGLYHRVRNPIYLGALMILLGYILWFGSVWVTVYSVFGFLAFHFLIVVIEEPMLRHNFGAAYEEYRKRVPRWLPKLSSDK